MQLSTAESDSHMPRSTVQSDLVEDAIISDESAVLREDVFRKSYRASAWVVS